MLCVPACVCACVRACVHVSSTLLRLQRLVHMLVFADRYMQVCLLVGFTAAFMNKPLNNQVQCVSFLSNVRNFSRQH